MSTLRTVVKFTFLNRFRAKSFIGTTILLAVLISVGINLPSIIAAFSSGEGAKVGVFESGSGVAAELGNYFARQEQAPVKIVSFKDRGGKEANDKFARELVAKKEVKGFLLEKPAAGSDEFPSFTYLSQGSFMQQGTNTDIQNALQIVKQGMVVKGLGLSDKQLTLLNAPVAVEAVQISLGADGAAGQGETAGKTQSEQLVAYILVYSLMILLFMALSMYGSLTASEITAEKSSRVMEILITSISPLMQMFGKVVGMFLLGLFQMAVFFLVALLNLNLPNNKSFFADNHLNFGAAPVSLYLYFILFYLAGFFLYVILYAAIGSLVSRTEELGQAIMPITLLTLAAFYIGIYGMNDPSSTFVVVTSYIPFFSPILMFLRIGMIGVPAWEIWLSFTILAASIVFLGWLSAKIYRTGVLMYGKRPSVKEIRRAMKAYRA